MNLYARDSVEKSSGRDQQSSSISHPSVPRNDGEPPISSNRRQYQPSAVARANHTPEYLIPGAFAVAGPEYDAGHDDWEDSTVQVGNEPLPEQEEGLSASDTLPAVADAVVVDPNRKRMLKESKEPSLLPPLVEAQVDATCTLEKRRTKIAVLMVVVLLIVGISLGVTLPFSSTDDTAGLTTPPTASPTSLSWVDTGSIHNFEGTIMDLSPDGTHVALTGLTDVRVFDDNGDGTWSQMGNVISFVAASSVSLGDDRLAVGSVQGGQVSVYELQDNIWQQVGDTISTQGWTVKLSQDGNVLAIETVDAAQVYRLDESTSWARMDGNEILATFNRASAGKAFTRMAMDSKGSTLIVDLSVYQYDTSSDSWTENILGIDREPPDTPVSMSGDGKTVAVAQPQSNINGYNSGRVRVFCLQEKMWNQVGNDIIGDGAVNGFFGWSHALSKDGSRIAIMNNPSVGQPRATLFRIDGSRWVKLLEDVPSAVYNGTIVISEDGNRVALGGEDSVKIYDVVGV